MQIFLISHEMDNFPNKYMFTKLTPLEYVWMKWAQKLTPSDRGRLNRPK